MAGDDNRTLLREGSRSGGTAMAAHDTMMEGTPVPGAPAVEKICCVCGANVAGKKRMKDAEGRYWCYECGMEDTVRKHPEQGTECPECHTKLPAAQLVEFGGRKVCPGCEVKLKQQKKRDDARIAAAAEEARRAEARKKQIMITVGILVAIIAIWVLSTVLSG